MVRTKEAKQYLLESGVAGSVTCSPVARRCVDSGLALILRKQHPLRRSGLERSVIEFLILVNCDAAFFN